jgi:hypothetical protein
MPDTGAPKTDQESTTPPTTTTDEGTKPTEKADPWEGLPDEFAWTKAAVESANREAAARRVALRDLEEKTKDAKSPEEFEAAVKDFNTKQADLEIALERERAARKHKLADDVLEFLTGKTPEEIEKQAEKLAALKPAGEKPPVVITTTPPAGGVKPGDQAPKEKSGYDEWKAWRSRR